MASPFLLATMAEAGQIIIYRDSPRDSHHRYPVHERRRRPARKRVTVEFIAQGSEWANVYVDGRRIFSPRNANRRKQFTFREGAYEIKITGTDYFDVWAEGYLDIGRDDTNIVVINFSDRGVRIAGDPYAWIPVAAQRR
ncbi:hypothetical protein [Leptothoe kymatousa]|uniref:PEGA domain-containing protein n=1 Tax=Leptothoe kymatousa TAU-MAC 1615 TaxID=2364775 RepID=A0ABS5Y1R4_9CYAN|nr:hypothetical protein [Leptothoe kymatousa]MBT9311727.1 hypothetical protein [Leptothoe kymatousa TAU-MAC 1615]